MRFQSRSHDLVRPSRRNRIFPLFAVLFCLMVTAIVIDVPAAYAEEHDQPRRLTVDARDLLARMTTQGDPDGGQNKVPDAEDSSKSKAQHISSVLGAGTHATSELGPWYVVNLEIIKAYLATVWWRR